MSSPTTVSDQPSVVLVHGAFADASSWAGVIERLQARGVAVKAPANPLRGLSSDAAYLASVLEQTPGPVVAVGHSYGGAVISDAARRSTNVVGLVFVAAFAPDEGEVLGQVAASSRDSTLMTAVVPQTYPLANGERGTELTIDPAKFRAVFAWDLSVEQAATLAATQRPIADAAFTEPAGSPAWKHLPSWAIVAAPDEAAGADLVRSMAARAGATTTEIHASHLLMISQPDAVSEVILEAVEAARVPEPIGAPG